MIYPLQLKIQNFSKNCLIWAVRAHKFKSYEHYIEIAQELCRNYTIKVQDAETSKKHNLQYWTPFGPKSLQSEVMIIY